MKDHNNWQERAVALLMPFAFVIVFILIAVLWLQNDRKEQPVVQAEAESETQSAVITADTQTEESSGNTEEIARIMNEMTLSEKIAQMFIVTPEALTGVDNVAAAGETTKNAFDERPVGGLIYFDGNLQAEEQLRTMLSDMNQISRNRLGLPAFLSVDEEGGTVVRVGGREGFGAENTASMNSIGQSGDPAKAYEAGAHIGSYLHGYGFNLDYAPVADVLDSSENQVIGDRSFGTDPQTAARMVAEAVKGFKSQGVLTTLKHFPGHGTTAEDSHLDFAYNNKTKEELAAFEFIPFKKGIEAGADMVMVGHISLPNVTGDNTPSTLSKEVITDMLRGDLGFQGVVITDAMNMGAIANNYSAAEAAGGAIKAGADIILMPADFQSAYAGVLEAVESGDLTEERINESVRRIIALKMQM